MKRVVHRERFETENDGSWEDCCPVALKDEHQDPDEGTSEEGDEAKW